MRPAAWFTILVLAAACNNVAGNGGNRDGSVGDDDDDDDGPDAGPMPDAVVPTVSPEIDGRIVINEFMASNAMTAGDETGNAGDWIELYNPTTVTLSLHGYSITDNLTQPGKHHFNGVILPAGAHLVLWADDRPTAGAMHLGFKLDGATGEIGLARPDGSYIDRVRYGDQETDFSAARTPDGSNQWKTVWNVTPGAANGTGTGTPMGLEQPSAPPEMVPATGDLSEHILGYDEMPELALIVSAAGVDALEAEPFVYVSAQLVFEGRTYGPIGLRLKGQNSFLPFSQKPSLRINVDQYNENAKFWGLKDLTLNNMSGDFSMMHERLSYWVMRRAGVPASRANHLRLTINGQFYGLYTNLETVKKKMIGRWFSQDSGSLFEGTDVDFRANYISRFELESGPEDRTLLDGLAAALTMPSADAAITAAGGFADMNRFLRYWAVCSVVGQFDALPYSAPGDDFYVYADPTTHRLSFLPWGMDETFYAGSFDVTNTFSVFAQRCKESPSCFDEYKRQTYEVQALTEQINLLGERERVRLQIAPYIAMDTRKPYTDQQVANSQSALRWFITERRQHLDTMLAPL